MNEAFVIEFLERAMESDESFKACWDRAKYAVWAFKSRVRQGSHITPVMIQNFRNYSFIVICMEPNALEEAVQEAIFA